MLPASIVSFVRMNVPPILLALSGAFVAACGQIVPIGDDQACPCASGYTCCGSACVVGDSCPADGGSQPLCPGTLALGTQSVPGEPDASTLPQVQTVTGKVEGALKEGTSVAFSYATSVWPKPYGWQLDGWLVTATTGQSCTFQIWAETDAGIEPLSLVVYGPLDGLETQTCSGVLVDDGAMVGPAIHFRPASPGSYFVAPFHNVVQTSSGLAFQGLNDSAYAESFILMNRDE
jgi:hypothetical protein